MSTAVETCAELLTTLSDRGILTAEAKAAARMFQQSAPASAPRDLMTHLVSRGHLTRFQADSILRGAIDDLALSQYTLLDVLGTGTMGTVYRARKASDDSLYVVKTVPRKNVINLKSIVEKVEALKQVRHPRVSAMVSIGAQADRIFMAWPMLEGGTRLDELVQRQGQLPARQAAQIALQVASGLQAYHEHELFHGLLKTSDILIGSDRRVRILDFGVGFLLTCERGKSLLSTMTNGKALAKGLDCASPEAIMDPLARTVHGDQYSLGCILYYCLAGQYPFPDTNPVKKMLAHQFEEATPIQELAPQTPAKLVRIVERLLSKTPAERYLTTEELVAELQAVTSDSRNGMGTTPVTSRPSVPGPLRPSTPGTNRAPTPGTVRPVANSPSSPVTTRPVAPTALLESEADPTPSPEPTPAPARASQRLAGVWFTLTGIAAGVGAAALAWWFR